MARRECLVRRKARAKKEIDILERALTRLADVVAKEFGFDYRDEPGAGAAGGLGFGLMSFCGAKVRPGFDVVAEAVGPRIENQRCRCCDYGRGEFGSADARRKNTSRRGAAGAETRQTRFRNCRPRSQRSRSARDFRRRLRERAAGNESGRKHETRCGTIARERTRAGKNIVAAVYDRRTNDLLKHQDCRASVSDATSEV